MTIKIKKKSAFKSVNFDLSGLVNDCIQAMILSKLNLKRPIFIKKVEYFLTYTVCEYTKEKTLSSVFLRLRKSKELIRVTAREIEVTGATIVEFIDYLNEKGGKEFFDAKLQLSLI